jgi:hypothetical protein
MSALYDQVTYNQVFDWPDTDPDAFLDLPEDNFLDYCPEEEEYEEIYDEWPNRGRFGNLPALSFLTTNNFPPVTKFDDVDPYFVDQYEKYKTTLASLQKERDELQAKSVKVMEELQKAEDVPKTYTAAKWGAISARDALVKRLTKDMQEANERLNAKSQEIHSLMESKKTLCDFMEQHESNLKWYNKVLEEQDADFEALYGRVEPLTDAAFIHLFFTCEKVETNNGSDVYRFENEVVLQRCMRALHLGKVSFKRIGLMDIQL